MQRGGGGGVHLQTLFPRELLQLGEFALVGGGVTSQHSLLRERARDEARRRRVRQEHELLHQVVTLARLVREDGHGGPRVLVQPEQQLGLVQAQRTAREAPSAHRARRAIQVAHRPRHRAGIPARPVLGAGVVDPHRSVPLFGRRDRLLQRLHAGAPRVARVDHRLRGAVVQLRARPNDAPPEPLGAHVALGAHLPLGAERQALDARVERAQVLAQQTGEHGHHLVHQVGARASETRLFVQRRARLDEKRDVRDVHAHAQAPIRKPLAVQRVVQVARRRRVDRNHARLGEVAPRRALALGDGPPPVTLAGCGVKENRHLGKAPQRLGRERRSAENRVFGDERRRRRRQILGVSQNLGHHATRVRLRGRPAVQARQHQTFPERLHALRGRRRDAHLGRQRGLAGLDPHEGQLRVRGEKTKRPRAARRVAVRAVEVPRHDVATGRRLVHGHDASDRTQGGAAHAARARRLGEKPSLFVRTGRPRAAGNALIAGNVVVVFERVHAQLAHPTTQLVASAVLPSGSRGARP